MAIIDKKFIHFKNYDDFISQAGVGSVDNITTPTSGSEDTRNAVYGQIKGSSIVFIKDTKQIWTHGQLYSCNVDASNALWVDENNVVNRENLLINGTRANTTYSYGNSEDGLMFVDTYTFEGNTMLNSISLEGANGINLQSLAVDNPNLDEVTSGKMSRLSISDGQVTYEGVQLNPGVEISPVSLFVMNPSTFSYSAYNVNTTTGNMDSVGGLVINESNVQIGHKSSETIHSLLINDDGVFVDEKKVCFEMLNVTYSELKNLRDSAQLIPGAMYRLTDYECTTSQENTASAGHKFDIILTALSTNTLSEEASVALHEGDNYFANTNLSAWKVWYTLDNDSQRFNWADEANGKGVIYRMIDEKNNDLPYDFKNILYVENNYTYEVNELGNAISLSNPLEISYSLLVDTDQEYNGKNDVIVEISQSDETPDKAGQDVWVLYKTDLGDYQEEDGVDYEDMFVFVDKYDYNGQTWDRWRKAEFNEDAWHWVTHEGSSVCILTEQLLDIASEERVYRYTFNLEEYIDNLNSSDASMLSKDPENNAGVYNNYMQSCPVDPEGISTSLYSLPINIFKITSTKLFSIFGNHFSEMYTANTFTGHEFTANKFDLGCFGNTFANLSMSTFGTYFCGNILGDAGLISCGLYTSSNTISGSGLTLGNYVMDCDIDGWYLTIMSNTGGFSITGGNAVIMPINGFVDGRKSIEIPDHEYPVKVAQNSLGEIKIYNEADLIA